MIAFRSMPTVPRPILVFFLVDVGLYVAYVVNAIIGRPSNLIDHILRLNGESNLPSWYSTIQLFCVFVLCTIISLNKAKARGVSLPLLIPPAAFLLISMDETMQIHELLGDLTDALLPHGSRAGSLFHHTGIWMFVIGAPVIVLLGMSAPSLARDYFGGKPRSFRKFIFGMAVMLMGALGFEAVSNFAEFSIWPTVGNTLEEGMEMLGIGVVLWAMYDVAADDAPFGNGELPSTECPR